MGPGWHGSREGLGLADEARPGDSDDGRARYVAIITDGNGRWASRRSLPVLAGHEAGAEFSFMLMKTVSVLDSSPLSLIVPVRILTTPGLVRSPPL